MSERLLIVDDEESMRRLCQRTLGAVSTDIGTAPDADSALALIKKSPYDLVITDLQMPGGRNGIDLVQEIKRHSPSADVIVMTAFPSVDNAVPVLKDGACEYLVKPFDQDVLRLAVTRCFEKRRLLTGLQREDRLQEELQSAYTQLHELEQLKEAFLGRVSHEFRSPIALLFMTLERLKAMTPGIPARKLCSLIEQRLRRLHDVIEQVLLFTTIRQRDFQCKKKPFHGRQILERLLKELSPFWKGKDVTIDLRWELRDMLLGDCRLIEKMFKNLLLNAIQFSREKGTITIQARKCSSGAEIAFADTGIGIPREKLSNVFDSFYQVAAYLTREVGGLGLGLATVRRIAELHGGNVRVESASGKGSVFTVHLP